MRYVGFDLGDGESAVAVLEQHSGIEPVILPVDGCRSILSAVGRVRGDVVIGERAYTDGLSENLSVRFKSRFPDDPNSNETVTLFAKSVLSLLREEGALREGDRFVVGCPAGWNAACRARYRDLLARAGMENPQVISESRAAFLYAKYARTVALDIDVLRESALVIDMGSSTLDFAYIVDGRETGVGTFGETRLGGGLLDAELLRLAIEKSKDRDALKTVFAQSRSWYSYAEIEARRVKERYYSEEATNPKASVSKPLRIYFDGTQKLTLELNAWIADRLVEEPLAALNGESFAVALTAALSCARQVTAGNPPRVVLLTGGASRMRFFQEQCREAFPDAIAVCCPEPEFSIAKGLAYAGCIDENMRAFRRRIAEEITDERVGEIALASLPELTPGIVDALAGLMLEEAVIPAASQWKAGDFHTLADMNQWMQNRLERVMQSELAERALSPVIGSWLRSLGGELQAMIDPICDLYQVPRTEMRLSFSQSGGVGGIQIGAGELLGFPLLRAVVGAMLGVLGGALCGGGGVALIAAGPLGFLAGALAGVVVGALGWPALSGILLKANLPRPLRLINVEKSLRGDAARRSLKEAIRREISGRDSAFAGQVAKGFTDAFQTYLRQIAQAAEVPIQ